MYDITTGAVEYALRGLAIRSDVRANNVANVNTPNFRGQRVEFEGQLRAALEQGGGLAAPAIRADMSMPNAAGTTVSLETEMVGMLEDNLLRESMIAAFNHKANVMRSAIAGR